MSNILKEIVGKIPVITRLPTETKDGGVRYTSSAEAGYDLLAVMIGPNRNSFLTESRMAITEGTVSQNVRTQTADLQLPNDGVLLK